MKNKTEEERARIVRERNRKAQQVSADTWGRLEWWSFVGNHI